MVEEDSDIECTFRRRLRTAILSETGSVEVNVKVEQTEPMVAPQWSLSDYARLNVEGATSSIVRHPIAANSF